MNIHSIYGLFRGPFRTKRMGKVWDSFGLSEDTLVLDVGGASHNWLLLPEHPRVVLLNIEPIEGPDMLSVVGDARRLPFKDKSFDVVFSNSLIEHLFTFQGQQQFAEECRRVAERYFVQSPNQRFPVEPHLLTPFIHWLPKKARVRLLRNFTVLGWLDRPDRQQCERFVEEVRMLTTREMRILFPDAEIWRERFLGLTKSVMAAKRSTG
jgi:Methyltransferase domain